ncbi:glucose dehydrogenase [FAD, quinone]-like isoform X2 [Anticarsia gemmatalis]
MYVLWMMTHVALSQALQLQQVEDNPGILPVKEGQASLSLYDWNIIKKLDLELSKMSWACNEALTSNIVNSYQVAGPLFVQTLQSFLAAQCALTGDHLWPQDATQAVLEDPNYDFIVVGAGSAGSVVANRLSENPAWKVLLVEAGGNPTLSTEIPQLFYNSLSSPIDWGYQTQPQDGACRGYRNKGCAWPRGKVLGGSSSINAMFYVRANKADYDQWAADGNYGWSYEEVLPYFLKIETYNGDITEQNKKYHRRGGPINVVVEKEPDPLENMIIQAAVELGMKNLSDVNADNQMGIVLTHTNVKDNYRFGTARGYLGPAKERNNLHVMKNAHAKHILFSPGTNKVSGVLIHKDGKDITVNARKEVICSGGSINSPQLLMLSGLGPKEHLTEMGIEVKADLPVGENLQDHVFAPIFYSMPGDKEMSSLANIFGALVQYMLEGSGPLKDIRPHRVISFYNTTDPTSSIPDIQYHYLVLPPGVANMIDVFDKHGLGDEVHSKFLKMNEDKFVIVVYNVVLHPKSSGKIVLASKNPFDKPLIHAEYFKDPEDMACMIRAMKQHALKLGDTNTFKKAGFEMEWMELDACQKFEKGSDEHLECIARELTFSLYHPTSTVKMGPDSDPTSVVDPELRVRKVKGLRVIDASIMPFVVRGNTNIPTIMIGEKGADMIKDFWLNRQHEEL